VSEGGRRDRLRDSAAIQSPPARDFDGLDRSWLACYGESMKNITVSLDDDVYRRARVKAAELDTSVSALVKKYLVELAGQETDFERRRRLQAETLATIRSFSAADRLTRDEVHARRAIR
jgi:hypothetical protein